MIKNVEKSLRWIIKKEQWTTDIFILNVVSHTN